jgi:uncharacterized protein YggU (UPF0235/DUF167 family)
MARIPVKVHPRARRTRAAGKFGEAWKLDLAAPPVDGKANDECVRFFAELAGVPRARVRSTSGVRRSIARLVCSVGSTGPPRLRLPDAPPSLAGPSPDH